MFKNYTGLDRNSKRTWLPQEEEFSIKDKENSMQLSLFDEDEQKTNLQESSELSEKQSNTDIYFPVVHDLVDEIEAFLQASGKSSEKQEVIESLTKMLQKYAVLKGTPLMERINNLIVSTCENYCSIHLSEDEVNELWS